jgi:hypothetical protein
MRTHEADKLVGSDLVWIIGSSALAASTFEIDEALQEMLRRAAKVARTEPGA